jgi:flagellar L-ring protein precursor FlgH
VNTLCTRGAVVRTLCGACAALCAALAGCSTTDLNPRPKVDVLQPTSMRPLPQQPPALNNGAIFQTRMYRPLFEDYRARLVGDTITVQIVESLSATQTANSSIDKTGTVSGSATALPGLSATSSILGRLGVGITSDNSFAGKGSTVNSNDFTGTITATVIEVLPNGHLIISAEKQIGVNHNVDTLKFSGQIDPMTIQSGNTVASTQIANVRIEQRGKGSQADAQGIGWLGRFFLNVLPI